MTDGDVTAGDVTDDAERPSTEGEPPADPRRPGLSRRALLIGGAGVAVLAAGGITTAIVTTRGGDDVVPELGSPGSPGLLVPELLGSQPFTVAHRGGSADWPEMSLLAYRRAVDAGVDALEISLARSSDGVWFGLHDETLDRTSGTTGFVASQHSWAEIDEFTIAPPVGSGSDPEQPYLRFEDLVREFGTTHTLFVDPKYVPREHFAELFDLMGSLVDDPARTFVAKGFFQSTDWADAAAERGLQSWGFFYGPDIAGDATRTAELAEPWSMLGLDVQAGDGEWARILAYGKPVIGHVLQTRSEFDEVVERGAAGGMVAGIREVLG